MELGDEEEYSIVGSAEADSCTNKISNELPLSEKRFLDCPKELSLRLMSLQVRYTIKFQMLINRVFKKLGSGK